MRLLNTHQLSTPTTADREPAACTTCIAGTETRARPLPGAHLRAALCNARLSTVPKRESLTGMLHRLYSWGGGRSQLSSTLLPAVHRVASLAAHTSTHMSLRQPLALGSITHRCGGICWARHAWCQSVTVDSTRARRKRGRRLQPIPWRTHADQHTHWHA